MKILKFLLISLLTLIILSSCQKSNTLLKKPDVGIEIPNNKAAITGYIVRGKKSEPMVGMVIRLGEVIWNDDKTDGSFIIDGANSPSTITDEQGFFILNNLDENDYVLILGNLEESPTVVVQKDNKEKAEIFSPKLNKDLFVGNLNLDDY